MPDAAQENRDDPSASGHVVGRDRALAVVGRFLDGLSRPAALVVTGGPGIGKTTILDEARRQAAARGMTVLSCRPDPAEVTLSFGGLVDLFDGVPSERFADLPGAQRSALDIALRRRPADTRLPDPLAVSAGVRAAFTVLTTDMPMVLAIDDVQWLDPSTGAILAYILRRLTFERIGLLIVRRTGPGADEGVNDDGPLTGLEFVMSVPVEHLELESLSLSAMHHIIHARTGQVLPRPLLHRVTEASGGNPFLAIAMVTSMAEEGRRPGAGEPLPAPGSILDHTARRVACLPTAARDVLLAVASLSPATPGRVGQIVGYDPRPGLDAAREAGILDGRPDVLRFVHPLYAESVVRLAPEDQRRAIHQRIADMLDEPEARARHLALSAEPPDESIAAALEAGAAAARARGGLRAAADLLVTATRFTPPSDRRGSGRRGLAAAELTILAGDRGAARVLLHELVNDADSPLRQRAAGLYAEIVASDGDVDAARTILLGAQKTSTEPATTARIELDLAYTSLLRMAPASAAISAAAARAAAQGSGDGALLAETLAYEGLSRLLAGSDPVEADLAASLALEDRTRPPYMGLPASGVIGLIRAFTARHDEARDLLATARANLDALGDDADLAHVLLWSSWLEMRTGRLPEATTAAAQAATMAQTTGSELLHTWSVAQGALVEAHRGHGAAADAQIAVARRGPGQGGIVTAWIAAAEGLARLSEGDGSGAAAAFAPVLRLEVPEPLAEPVLAFFLPDAVEALAAAGDLGTASAVLAPFEAVARSRDRAWALATALRAQAAIDAAEGRPTRAAEALRAALVGHDATDLPLDRARTLLALGRVERRIGERRAAREHLAEAEARFAGAGALGWTQQAQAELARVPGQRAPTTELTPGERRVAELSGTGRTNREVAAVLFLSPKTVEANLARIYRKLGITTRAELGAWAADRAGRGSEPEM